MKNLILASLMACVVYSISFAGEKDSLTSGGVQHEISPVYISDFTEVKSSLQNLSIHQNGRLPFSTPSSEQPEPLLIQSQEDRKATGKRQYRCWLYGKHDDSFRVRRGYIKEALDSGIVLQVSAKENSFNMNEKSLYFRNSYDIRKIALRKQHSVAKGMIKGFGIGFLTGGLLGFAGIPDYGIFNTPPPEENALAGALLFSLPGAIIGGSLGFLRISFPIDYNHKRYEMQKKQIAKYRLPDS